MTNHQSSLRRRNICHLFLTVIPPPSCKSSPGQEKQPPGESHCCFAVCQRSVRASSSLPTTNKAFAPSSSPTRHLGQYLVQPKDTVDPAKQDGVVYRIPCECGKDYIGETGRSMLEKIKEQDRDIPLAIPRPPSFLSTPIRPATTRFEMR